MVMVLSTSNDYTKINPLPLSRDIHTTQAISPALVPIITTSDTYSALKNNKNQVQSANPEK